MTLGSAFGQVSFTRISLNVTSTPSYSYVGTTNGYFTSSSDALGPGSSSVTQTSSGAWEAAVSYLGSSPPAGVSIKYSMTDTATSYYYLRGSGSNPSSGSVHPYSEADSNQTVTAAPGIINQTSTTQTNTVQSGPTVKTVTTLYATGWTYNSFTGYYNSSVLVQSSSCQTSGSISAPTYGDSKSNEASGFAEDNFAFVSIS
jgi:hypothetical protein